MSDPLFDRAALEPHIRRMVLQQEATASATPPLQEGVGKWPHIAHAAGNLADGLSTYVALKNPNNYEANPLLPNHGGAVLAIKAASILPEALLMRLLAKKGHPTIAKALGYGLGAAGGAATVGNIKNARKPR